jgi:ferredoxin
MQPNTQASTTGANVCETAVSDVYRIADEVYRVTTEGKTTTDSVEMGLASAVAFAACKTPAAVDAAINVWLSKARAAGNTDVDPPSAAAAASTRQVMCSSIIGDKPADFCD